MKFPKTWDRVKGVAGTAIGSDAVPPFDVPPNSTLDCMLATRVVSINGWPPHRVSVVCRRMDASPAAKPAAIPVDCYFYEENLACWIKVNTSAVTVLPVNDVPGGAQYQDGTPAFFDLISLLDFPNVRQNLDGASGGNLHLFFRATDPGALPNGTYRFAAGADLTTFP